MIFEAPPQESSPQYSPSLALSKNSQERRAFQFFQEQTAHQLSGLFEERFWFQCILQVASRDTAIQHAIYALSSFHENFIAGRGFNPSNHNFALKQYEIAIQRTRISAQQPQSLFVCFITSLLFLSIESVQGNTASAIQLSKHSRVVFNQLISDKSQPITCVEELNEMEKFVQRTEIHADKLIGDVRPDLCVRTQISICALPPPGRFYSVSQARAYLEDLLYQGRKAFFEPDGPSGIIVRERLLEWTVATEDLEKRLELNMPRERRALALLKMHKLKHQILCELPKPLERIDHDHPFWETQQDKFQELVDLAAEATAIDQPQKPSLTFNYGIVFTMLVTAMRCRDPILRRKAIAVMRASNQVEFVWNAQLAAASAERFIEIEEAGLGTIRSASDVPITARLCRVKVGFGATPNTGVMEYISRWRPHPIRETIWRKDGRFLLSSTAECGFRKMIPVDLERPAGEAALSDTIYTLG